jgi:hypothetical protein
MKTRIAMLTIALNTSICIQSLASSTNPGDVIKVINNPQPMSFATFGASVEVVGEDIVVGALGAKRGSFFEGAVYLIEGTGDSAGQVIHEFRRPTPQDYDRFGHALDTVGNSIIVADPRFMVGGLEYVGAVHIFDSVSGSYIRTIHNPSPTRGDHFGWSIDSLGTTLAISQLSEQGGDPAVFLFDTNTGDLLRTIVKPPDADDFGRSVAFVGDQIVVGAPRDEPSSALTNSGSVFAFDRTTGGLIRKLENPTPADFDEFGMSVAGIGDKLVVGGTSDEIYIYSRDDGTLLHTIGDPSSSHGSFGEVLSRYGDNLLASARYGPMVHLIDLDTGNVLFTFDVPGASNFPALVGTQVSLANQNGNIVVGNPAWDSGIGFPADEGRVFIIRGVPEPSYLVHIIGGAGVAAYSVSRQRRNRRVR